MLAGKVIPADPKVLEFAEVAGFSDQQYKVYQCYVDLTAEKKGEKPGMIELAEYVVSRFKSIRSNFDAPSASRCIRQAQNRASDAGWQPPAELKVDRDVANKNLRTVEKKLRNQVSTYVVTWAQNATPVHQGFLKSLEQFCKHRGAVLLVIAGRYRNPTSIWTWHNQENEYWAEEVAPYLIEDRVELNDNLVVMGDIKTIPTAENPLSGFQSITRDKSGIFGHAKVALGVVATPQNTMPKILTTTGAVTERNYVDAKAGKKGEFHHTFGATVVEIQDDLFHMRQINACDDGSFIDLKHEYKPNGFKLAARAKGIVLGDSHGDFMDPVCEKAIFGKGGMVDFFEPENIVFHDVYDGYSGSHHHKGQMFTKLAKRRSNRDDVRGEVIRTLDKFSSWMRDDTNFWLVDSNHNQHLVTWIQETDPRKDLVNLPFWVEIVGMMEPGVIMTKNGAKYPNPLQLMAEKHLGKDKRVRFLTRDDRLMIAGIDCGNHGHRGPNGARGTIRNYAFLGVKTITGHGHSPGIHHGHYRVGTNTYLELEYNEGPSSWLQTDCVIYANGKRSLIHKINGNWRAVRRRKQ
jgi:hypothetical protein